MTNKLLEIFEVKSNPDDELDKAILELHKRGFSVKKINVMNVVEMKKYPDIFKMVREGKDLPIIRLEKKISTKNQLIKMANLPEQP
jgi:hypothetical protein